MLGTSNRRKQCAKGKKTGHHVATCVCGFDVLDVAAVPYCPQKCRSALGRQRTEAALICLTAFTEMFRGHIQRSLGAPRLPTNEPLAHGASNRVGRTAGVAFRKVTVQISEQKWKGSAPSRGVLQPETSTCGPQSPTGSSAPQTPTDSQQFGLCAWPLARL